MCVNFADQIWQANNSSRDRDGAKCLLSWNSCSCIFFLDPTNADVAEISNIYKIYLTS